MVTLSSDLNNLTVQSPIFKDVKYYLSGDVPEKVIQLLQGGGADQSKYFSEFVTHLICGFNPIDSDLIEADDLYEIPAVTVQWVLASVKLGKLANCRAFSANKNKLFGNVTACLAKVNSKDAKRLCAIITYHGGSVKINLDARCTHLICGSANGRRYNTALNLTRIKIVTPDWVIDSLETKCLAVSELYHPKLLLVLQQPQSKMSSKISAITGFDFEEGLARSEVPTQNLSENKDDSTQALLDELKQRMPWNHPPSTIPVSTSSPNTPPQNTTQFTQSTAPPTTLNLPKSLQQAVAGHKLQKQISQTMLQQHNQTRVGSPTAAPMTPPQNFQPQSQQSKLQQNPNMRQAIVSTIIQQLSQGNTVQSPQQSTTTMAGQQQQTNAATAQQPHGLSAIQMQQQRLLQQHTFRMQMMQQQQNQVQNKTITIQQQQTFLQHQQLQLQQQLHQQRQLQQQQEQQQQQQSPNMVQQSSNMVQQTPNMVQQMHQNVQQQNNQTIQQTTAMSQAQQQIHNITQMLTQSANLQQAQLNQQKLNQQTAAQQAVQSIAQHLQQSTQNLQQQQQQQSNLGQPQIISQQVIGSNIQTMTTQSQSQSTIQSSVSSLSLQQQHQNIGLAQQNILSHSQVTNASNLQLSQGVQQNILHQQIQSQQNVQQTQATVQGSWRQQGIQMVQNVTGQHQLIRNPIVQQRGQNQVLLQQQLIQNQQQGQGSGQQPVTQQIITQQGQLGQGHHQILVQKQQIIQQGGPQQVLINQHTGQQQILVHGNQHVTLQSGQQLVSQSGLIQGQGGQQIISQGGQHIITQGGQGHQVLIAQNSQQVVGQGQQLIQGQAVTAGQGVQQIISNQGGQQIVQTATGQNIAWQQQQYLQRQQIGQAAAVGPRLAYSHGGGRQLIHLDAQTHAQLQQMDPQQRALFVAQLQKRRQLHMQRANALALQQQQSTVPGSPTAQTATGTAQSVTFIRGQIPPGLTQQQQVQWLQQQGARAAAVPTTPPVQQAQSPVGAVASGAVDGQHLQQLQLQRQQQYQRLQHLQAQRDHVAHQHANVIATGTPPRAVTPVQALPPEEAPGSTTPTQEQQNAAAVAAAGNTLVVNPKTKTALANMLSIRLQGATHTPEHEPSAAGTLRLLTAAHNAHNAGVVRAPAARVLLAPPHHVQPATAGSKVYAARPAPPRAQFYGHNPNLKLPPDLFLLGCVFHIVEYQQTYGVERVTRWSEEICRRGGEVEAGYGPRVTHVLCQTQKHGVVMQALRDAKRCVTAYWLSDAMTRRCVTPPWQALHLPTHHSPRDRPAKHHRVALSGFRNDERDRITFMVQHVGAQLTPYLSKDNTVLICKRADGNKYKKAREWNTPAVSATWLTDLLLGNMTALSQIENTKYQQFNVQSPFRMDYTLVSHLMNAWKMPINITQESHERAKRGASSTPPRTAKRPRLSPAPPLQLTGQPQVLLPGTAPRVMFSACKDANKLIPVIQHLGGQIVTKAADATHLIMDKLIRTCKLVTCLVTIKHLLTPEWIYDSLKLNTFADEAKYGLTDASFNETFKCDISEVLLYGEQRKKLFEGITFFLTPSVVPSRAVLKEIIELSGGKVDVKRKSYVAIQEMLKEKPNSYYALIVPTDLHLVHYLLQPEKCLNVVCNTEFVMSAIMRQSLRPEEFLVKID